MIKTKSFKTTQAFGLYPSIHISLPLSCQQSQYYHSDLCMSPSNSSNNNWKGNDYLLAKNSAPNLNVKYILSYSKIINKHLYSTVHHFIHVTK